MEKINKRKGITLISLVITIILILILAGITISVLLNNGIIDKAKFAKEQYANAQQDEIQDMDSVSNEIDDILNNVTTVGTRNQNANHYSTEEQEIGTWIDGKKLYRKVYVMKNFTTTSTVDISDLNYDYIHFSSRIKMTDGVWRETFYFPSNYFIDGLDNVKKCISYTFTSNYNGGTAYCVVEYTKTTDTAINN